MNRTRDAKPLPIATLLIAALAVAPCQAFAHGGGQLPPDIYITRADYTPPDPGSFVNYEIPHVHPLDLSPSATTLAACNTPDGSVEIFSVDGSGNLTHTDTIRVGYAPVSVRFRTDNELWVVNHISDSISVVDIAKGHEVATIQTYDGYDGSHAGDEPADVVFVTGGEALVSGSRSDVIQRYNATTLAYVGEFRLDGEDPRGLAVNSDGTRAYAAIFESGNGSTIMRGDDGGSAGFPPKNALADGLNPYQGANPPFNNGIPGTAWVAGGVSVVPADFMNSGAPPPPHVGLIVKKDSGGNWRDDNGAIWDNWIDGTDATMSGRFPGWDLMDNDIAFLTSGDSFTSATYVTHLMNFGMAIGYNPLNDTVVMVGTDSTNEVRFEPNLTGTFTTVQLSIVDASTGAVQALVDMNAEHLDIANGGTGNGAKAYDSGNLPQNVRDESIGDPRGVAFHPTGNRMYVSGMGSNNILVLDATTGERKGGVGHTIGLGDNTGPTGIVHHPSTNILYCLNKFEGSVVTIQTAPVGSETILQRIKFFDPTPDFINAGRVHLYDTHANSGLGQLACASCHVDARMDRLAWDLGNPAGGTPQGVEKFINTSDLITGLVGENPDDVHNFIFGAGAQDGQAYHTMKGPMTTQTLQDIIRHEPFHWRGDRDGVEEFAGAFQGLQGDDEPLNAFKMQEFEDFLSSIHFPPNPFRPLDNSLPGGPVLVGAGTNPNLPLPGHLSPGDSTGKVGFSALGTQLPDGSAWQGFDDYVDLLLDAGAISCVTCHSLPMGSGPATTAAGQPIPAGSLGQEHIGLVDNDGTGQPHIKVPQLRNQFDKEGFYLNQGINNSAANPSRAGFGLVHDGIVDGLPRFLAEPVFTVNSDQDLANIVAFAMCINGDDFDDLFTLTGHPSGTSPDGGPVQTAHAAIGHQVTITSGAPPQGDQDVIDLLVTLANSDKIGLIASGAPGGNRAGWYHVSGTGVGALFQPDDGGSAITLATLQGNASVDYPLTFMAVPAVSDVRMGADHDEDGALNGEEPAFNTDNGNPNDHRYVDGSFVGTPDGTPDAPFQTVNAGIVTAISTPGKNAVVHIQAGDYNELGAMDNFLNTKTILRAEGGTVRIGL